MTINNIQLTNKYLGIGTDKPKGEHYPTPRIAVTSLLDEISFGKNVAEPACGFGAISEVIKEYGYNVYSTDLNDWGYGISGHDFLTTNYYDDKEVDAVITNPPFNIPRGISAKFVERGLEITKPTNGQVAILQKLTFLEGVSRKRLFTELPFSHCLVFSKRLPRMHRFDYTGKESTSMIAFAWFVWDWSKSDESQPIIRWI